MVKEAEQAKGRSCDEEEGKRSLEAVGGSKEMSVGAR